MGGMGGRHAATTQGFYIRRGCDALAVAPTLGRPPLPNPISLRSLSPIRAATFMPPRGRPLLVVLSLVASSPVASPSSRPLPLVLRRRRRLPLPCSRGFFRLSSQLCPSRGIFWPLEFIELSSRKDDSSDAHCDHLPPGHIVAQVHSGSSNTCTSTDDAGAGVPFGCSVTADDLHIYWNNNARFRSFFAERSSLSDGLSRALPPSLSRLSR